jgi:hypothetical protein
MRIFSSLTALALLGLVAGGCGGKDGSAVNGGNGASSNGASSSTGGSIMLGGMGSGVGGNGSGATGTVIDPNSACAKGSANASLSGVNMFVMFDRSSSMNQKADKASGKTRWELTSAALNAFFASGNAAGLKLALRFFPHDKPSTGCNQDGCDVNACAMPLVPLDVLTADAAPTDKHEQALTDATTASAPGMAGQGTPISAALGGALQWAAAQRKLTPNENSVVVLVTDGQANGCDTDIDVISKLAADALAEAGVRTYAIGLTGSQEADMDQIAKDGGTEKGIFVADGADTQKQLLDALGAIRGQILDCDFPMPQPKPGVDVNPSLINVNYTPGSGTKSTLTQVADTAACTASGGWYYDDPAVPTRISLCKSTCDTVTADPKAALEILLGCATITTVPK